MFTHNNESSLASVARHLSGEQRKSGDLRAAGGEQDKAAPKTPCNAGGLEPELRNVRSGTALPHSHGEEEFDVTLGLFQLVEQQLQCLDGRHAGQSAAQYHHPAAFVRVVEQLLFART